MAIDTLLAGLPKSDFLREYFLKLPFAMRGGAAPFRELASWRQVEHILRDASADVSFARQGKPLEGPTPRDLDSVRRLHGEGYTISIRHAERHAADIAALADSFFADFRAPIDVHLFCTPGPQHGFGWHYDVEDVFFLQTEGAKEYSLRKNTVNPWPVLERFPVNLAVEREIMPITGCRLEAGDWLYIPAGYWHVAHAVEDSISLAIGLMSPTALDLLDHVRSTLAESIRWRQRLPHAEASPEEISEFLTGLASDLARQLTDQQLLDRFQAHQPRDAGEH